MEPRIQYAKTKDGVSIAYWTLGEGMPLVVTPSLPFSHLHLEWQIAEWRSWIAQLAETRMVVRYDSRGSGLSARDATDFSLEALVTHVVHYNHQLSVFHSAERRRHIWRSTHCKTGIH